MTEFEKLVKMLDEAGIPYERDDDADNFVNCFGEEYIKRIKYPKKGVDEVCSIVYGGTVRNLWTSYRRGDKI